MLICPRVGLVTAAASFNTDLRCTSDFHVLPVLLRAGMADPTFLSFETIHYTPVRQPNLVSRFGIDWTSLAPSIWLTLKAIRFTTAAERAAVIRAVPS